MMFVACSWRVQLSLTEYTVLRSVLWGGSGSGVQAAVVLVVLAVMLVRHVAVVVVDVALLEGVVEDLLTVHAQALKVKIKLKQFFSG